MTAAANRNVHGRGHNHTVPATSAAANVCLVSNASPANTPASATARLSVVTLNTTIAATDNATPRTSTRYRPSHGVSGRGNASATNNTLANAPTHTPRDRPASTPTQTAATIPDTSDNARPDPKPGSMT